MKQHEFAHVRMKHRFRDEFFKKSWEEKLMSILAEKGAQGWDLKAAYREMLAMHTHLIFSREKS